MNVSVRRRGMSHYKEPELAAFDIQNSPPKNGLPKPQEASRPPLPGFLREPLDAETGFDQKPYPVSRLCSRIGQVTAGATLTVSIFFVWIFFGSMMSDTLKNSASFADWPQASSFLDTLISRVSAEDMLPLDITDPSLDSINDEYMALRAQLTTEELQTYMETLQEEIEAIQQQESDLNTEFDLVQKEIKHIEKQGYDHNHDIRVSPDNISNPRWQEPVTPPRWQEPLSYAHNPGQEGIITPLRQTTQTAWPPPQWTRTATFLEEDWMAEEQPANLIQTDMALNTPSSGDFRIQLGSFRSERSAQSGWRQILTHNKDLLDVLEHSIDEVNLGNKGTYYRLQAGSFANADMAKILCNEIKIRHTDCLVVRR